MRSTHMQGAAAPGPVTPCRSDDAQTVASGLGTRGQGTAVSSDCAQADVGRKLIDGLVARAALLGIEVHRLADGAWLLRNARGVHLATVHGVDALGAAVAGVEAARRGAP